MSHPILQVRVVELATVDDGSLDDLVCFVSVGHRWLVFVSLWRHRVDAPDERLREAEVFVIGDCHGQGGPDHRSEATD